MRIADKMNYEQIRTNLSKNRSTMADLQNQAATQKRVTKPSDDPLAAGRVLTNKNDLQGNQQFLKSLRYAKSFLDYTDQSLGDLSEILVRAKELAISQSNDASANQDTRRAVATEVEQMHNATVAVGNRKLGDRFIFGGFRTQTTPFGDNGEYLGDAGEMNIHVDKENFLAMNVPGNRVFLGEGVDGRGAVKPFPPQAKTIEEFRVQKNNHEIDPRRGEATAGESEDVPTKPVNARGPASVNGLDIADRMQPKEEEASLGTDIFRTLRDLETSLRTNDKEGVQSSLNAIDGALNQVIRARSQVGSRAMTIDNLSTTLEKTKVDDQVQISALEDADIFGTVSEINKNQTTLQATLQTSGKLVQSSLLDFLR